MSLYLDIAKKSAREAGRIHLKYFGKPLRIKKKSSSYDLLTVADTESEKAAVSLIRRHFPGHNFLGEENKYPKTPSEFTWVIDPLDGTNNFASGLPIFCASVALKRKDTLLAGAVYDATRDELFYAEKGKGAYLNGRRIRVNGSRSLDESLLITGFYYDRGKKMVEALQTVMEFQFRRILGIRRLGAAALDLCYVASGRAAGFWEFELSPWDFSAGKLIVEEAGGKVTGKCGEPVDLAKPYFIVSSNGKIHDQMLAVINQKKEARKKKSEYGEINRL